jgi:glycosyltransferase involved in cell wall biosynthesis
MKVCQALQEVDGPVCLWTPGNETADWDILAENYGLRTPFETQWLRCNPRLKRYDFSWKAFRAALDWGADVIYTWTLQVAVLSVRKGVPVVLELHDRPMGKIGPRMFRTFLRKPSPKQLLTTTHYLRDKLVEEYHLPIPDSMWKPGPNGTDSERYAHLPTAEDARAQLGLAEGLTVVYSGHFYPGRGMEMLFALARAYPQANFVWIGGREKDIQPWREQLKSENMTNVVMTGFIQNAKLPLYQAAADILLMPYGKSISASGGGDIAEVINPMKMFDYLATGKAILASDLPILHEVLNDQNTVFCAAGDSADWAAALGRLIDNPELRMALGQQAKADSYQYDWKLRAQRALAWLTDER